MSNETNSVDELKFNSKMERLGSKLGNSSFSATSALTILGPKFRSIFNSKSGSIKPKIDLDDLILGFKDKYNNPPWNDDTETDLNTCLGNQKGLGIIEDIDDEIINWTDSKGRVKQSKISGLKNRYYKVK